MTTRTITTTIRIAIDNVDNVDTELMHNETRDVKRVRTALKPNIDEVPKFVLRFIAFDTRLHYIISEYWRTGRRRGGNNRNFVPPPVEADTNEDDWGVFSKVERVYMSFKLSFCCLKVVCAGIYFDLKKQRVLP